MNDPWWRWAWAPTAPEWSALFAGVTLLVAVVAALVALVQYRAHLAAENSRTRPYVIVDYSFRSVLMQVEIKNIGATAASEVTLTVDPPFQSGLADQAARLNKVFSGEETIAMLAPARRILYTFDRAPDYYAAKRPDRYMIVATYKDLPVRYVRRPAALWRKSPIVHSDRYPLDFRQWSQATTETDYDDKNWNIATRGERRQTQIVNSLASLVRIFGDHATASASAGAGALCAEANIAQDSGLVDEYEASHPVLDARKGIRSRRRGGLTSTTPRLRKSGR